MHIECAFFGELFAAAVVIPFLSPFQRIELREEEKIEANQARKRSKTAARNGGREENRSKSGPETEQDSC